MQQASTHPAPAVRMMGLTSILIAINVAVYVFMQMRGGPTFENLLAFGAKENGLIALGQIFRLFFPMFLHAHPLHLAVNMYGLYQVGRYLEFLAGQRNLFLVYLFAGITGNTCSFAFSPALSVGASGSLFGILLCLYVIQKYEQRLALEANEPIPKSSLGWMIILNGVISFVIPNIDWASHLGGAIAGVFCGLAIVMNHRWNLRFSRSVRYMMAESGKLGRKLYEREGFFYSLLFAVNGLFLSSWSQVGLGQKAFGSGVLAASKNSTETRTPETLRQFEILLTSPKSETNPEKLLDGALRLHKANKYASAAMVYEVLEVLNRQNLGATEFKSQSTAQILQVLKLSAERNEPPSEALLKNLQSSAVSTDSELDICRKPAELFKTLGFFSLSGKLYECAFYLDPVSLENASETVESYWHEPGDQKQDLFRFLEVIERAEQLQGRASPSSFPDSVGPI